MKIETVKYKVEPMSLEKQEAMKSIGISSSVLSEDRMDEATIISIGCGFAYQVTIELWDGEQIITYTSTGGHYGHCIATNAKADSPIEMVRCESNLKEKDNRAMDIVAKKFLSWVPKDLLGKISKNLV